MTVRSDIGKAMEIRVDLILAPRRGIETEETICAEALQAGCNEVGCAVTRCAGDDFRSGLRPNDLKDGFNDRDSLACTRSEDPY